MIIGLTYDLRDDYLKMGYSLEQTAEFDRAETIDSLEQAINHCGYKTERIGHIRNLVQMLSQGKKWDLIFNIAEGVKGFGREAQIPALLDAFSIPYTFSDPLMVSLTLHKEIAKRLLKSYGIPTAECTLVTNVSEIDRIDMGFPLFLKPVAEGTSKGISGKSMVQDKKQLQEVCTDLLKTFDQPVLVERYLSGREFTVGIIGQSDSAWAIGALEVIASDKAEPYACSYWNKENCEQVINYKLGDDLLAKKAIDIALKTWRAFGCRDAGRVDLRADQCGELFVLEVNPIPGLHPSHSDLPILCTLAGISYQQLIGYIVTNSINRIGH